MPVERLRIRTMSGDKGHSDQVVTLEEAKKVDLSGQVTIMPDGRVIHSWDELLQEIQNYPGPEVELVQFPALMGG